MKKTIISVTVILVVVIVLFVQPIEVHFYVIHKTEQPVPIEIYIDQDLDFNAISMQTIALHPTFEKDLTRFKNYKILVRNSALEEETEFNVTFCLRRHVLIGISNSGEEISLNRRFFRPIFQ